MKIPLLALIVFFAQSMFLYAQKPEEILFMVGEEPVTRSEFEYVYQKNSNNTENPYAPEQIKEYLDLYINFKRKVREAYQNGLDTTPAFKQEFEQYRQQLIRPYLSDKSKLNELVDEAYSRMLKEMNASHILINVSHDAIPADTLKAYNLAVEVMKKAKSGESFESLATEYSDDPSAEHNNGNLGYFTAFQMIYPFESAVYNLSLGEISNPVRTQFGYHVIKLNGQRAARGEIDVAHIMIRTPEGSYPANEDPAKAKADSLHKLLLADADFEALAMAHSDDASTAKKGGKLPTINSLDRRLPAEFVEAAFELDRDGKISEPFKTAYGWHIVKRFSHTPMQPKEDIREAIINKINRDSRADLATQAAVEKIKRDNGFKEYQKNFTKFRKKLDSSFVKEGWKGVEGKAANMQLFKIGNQTFTSGDFADWIKARKPAPASTNINYLANEYYNEFRTEKILTYERENLEVKYPEYKYLVKEYKEGILLFEITDNKVWSKAINDSAGLADFYQRNKNNYTGPEGAEAEVFETSNAAASKDVIKLLKQDTIAASKIALQLNEKYLATVTYYKKLYKKGDSEIIDAVGFKEGIYTQQRDGKMYSIRITKHIPEGPKPLNEIRGMVISDYQEELETTWMNTLEEKYPVKVNEDIFTNLFK